MFVLVFYFYKEECYVIFCRTTHFPLCTNRPDATRNVGYRPKNHIGAYILSEMFKLKKL